jgi:hypothetical protein
MTAPPQLSFTTQNSWLFIIICRSRHLILVKQHPHFIARKELFKLGLGATIFSRFTHTPIADACKWLTMVLLRLKNHILFHMQ